MSFKTEVEGMTSLDIDTTPTPGEFEEFLAAGVIDVTSKILTLDSGSAPLFTTSTIQTDNTGFDISGPILSIVRENGTTGSSYLRLEGIYASVATPSTFTYVGGAHGLSVGDVVRLSGFTEATELNGITGVLTSGLPGQALSFTLDGVYVDVTAETTGGIVERLSAENWIAVEKVPATNRFMVADSTSLSYRSSYHPAYWEIDGKAFVHPTPGGAGSRISISSITYPTPANGDSGILNWPDKYEYLVTLYAAFKTIHAYMSSLTIGTYNSDAIVGIPIPLVDFTFITPAPDMSNITLDAGVPTHTLNYSPAIANALGVMQDPLAEIASLSPPLYNTSGLTVALEAWAHSETASDAIAGLTTTFPTAPSLAADYFSIDLTKDVDDVSNPLPILWDPDDETTAAEGAFDKVGLLWADYTAAMTNEDFEEASAHLITITQMIEIRRDEYIKELDSYKVKVQRVIDTQVNKEDKQWVADLAKYNAEMNGYTTEVTNRFTRWSHDLNALTQEFSNVNSQKLAKVSADSTIKLHTFNADKTVYDAKVRGILDRSKNTLQTAMKQLDSQDNLDLQNALNEYKQEFDQYELDVRKYGEAVNKYTQEINAEIQEYNANLDREVTAWTKRQEYIVQDYNAKMQDHLNLFSSSLQKETTNYQWLQDQYARIKGEYDGAFALMAPQPAGP